MKHNALFEVFLALIQDLFDAENQIIQKLPYLIQAVSNKDLKETLNNHLNDTHFQIDRLKEIFKMIGEDIIDAKSACMETLFDQGEKGLRASWSPAVKDAYIIIACQKVGHYEIASYGSASALARHLNEITLDTHIDFDEISDLLEQSLDEECATDEILTDIAEGGFFTTGINEKAEKEEPNII